MTAFLLLFHLILTAIKKKHNILIIVSNQKWGKGWCTSARSCGQKGPTFQITAWWWELRTQRHQVWDYMSSDTPNFNILFIVPVKYTSILTQSFCLHHLVLWEVAPSYTILTGVFLHSLCHLVLRGHFTGQRLSQIGKDDVFLFHGCGDWLYYAKQHAGPWNYPRRAISDQFLFGRPYVGSWINSDYEPLWKTLVRVQTLQLLLWNHEARLVHAE